VRPTSPSEEAAEERGTGLERIGRRLIVPLALGLLVGAGLVLTASPQQLLASFQRFDLRLLPWILALSLVNYGLRFVRWEAYLRRLAVPLPRGTSLAVFGAGFLLSVTPGKAGELGKAWLVRELGGGPARRVVPVVLAERVTDLLGVLILIGWGAIAFPHGLWLALAMGAAVVAVVLVLTWRRGADLVFRMLRKLPLVGSRTPALIEVYDALCGLLSPALLWGALVLSTVAWGAEAVGFYLVVREYAPEAGLLPAVFNYTGATVVGSLSMLPGGLGAAEGSMAALLHGQGLATADANLVTLVVRGATLWFSVVLGLVALPFVARQLAARKGRAEPRGTR
jgi:glycosyltransferase 2 family protein